MPRPIKGKGKNEKGKEILLPRLVKGKGKNEKGKENNKQITKNDKKQKTMSNLLTIDTGAIDWARAQFALTAIYHWLFVPLTLGLALIMGIIETIYYRKRDEF